RSREAAGLSRQSRAAEHRVDGRAQTRRTARRAGTPPSSPQILRSGSARTVALYSVLFKTPRSRRFSRDPCAIASTLSPCCREASRGGSMRVLVLGGDGYLGWPTSLRFSARGDEVAIVDNFARRRWHLERGSDSLTPIATLHE